MRRAGLRTRVTASFAAGALAISAAVALLSYDLTRRTLLAGRERSATRAAFFDAGVARAGLASGNPDVVDVLRNLDTGSTRRAVVRRNGPTRVYPHRPGRRHRRDLHPQQPTCRRTPRRRIPHPGHLTAADYTTLLANASPSAHN